MDLSDRHSESQETIELTIDDLNKESRGKDNDKINGQNDQESKQILINSTQVPVSDSNKPPINGLMSNKLFMLITSSKWISDTGDWLSYLVKVMIISDLRFVSLMIALQSITPFVLAPFTGNLVERCKRKHILMLFCLMILVLNNSWVYVAYMYPEHWYLIYLNIIIQSIFGPIKNSSFQTLIPQIIKMNSHNLLTDESDVESDSPDNIKKIHEILIVRSNTVQTIMQSIVYIFGTAIGGIIIKYWGGMVNLILDSTSFILAFLLMICFVHMYDKRMRRDESGQIPMDHETDDLTDPVIPQEQITFKNGLGYCWKVQQIGQIILINALLYYVYGIIDIVNFKLGFEQYDDILVLSLILGLSSTGPIILYFDRSDRYIVNLIIGIVSMGMYGIVTVLTISENPVSISLTAIPWFIGLWLFNYIHSAYWIMMNSLLQKEEHSAFRGRLFSYSSGLIAVCYALGSYTGSYLGTYYWICISVSWIFISLLLIRFNRIETRGPN